MAQNKFAHRMMLIAALATAIPSLRMSAAEPKPLPRFEGIEHIIIADPQIELGMYFHVLPVPDQAPDDLLPAVLEPKTKMRPVLASQMDWLTAGPERIRDALGDAQSMRDVAVEQSSGQASAAAAGAAVGSVQRPIGMSEGAFNSAMIVGFIFAIWLTNSAYKDTMERRGKYAASLAAPLSELPAAKMPASIAAERLAQALPQGMSVERAMAPMPLEFFDEPIAKALAEHPRVLVAVPFVGMVPGLAGVRCSTLLFDLKPNPERARRGAYYMRKTAVGPKKEPISPFVVERSVVLSAISFASSIPAKDPEAIAQLEVQARERFIVSKTAVGPRRNSMINDREHALDEARAPIWYPNQLAPRMVAYWTAESGAPLERSIDACAASMRGMLETLLPVAPTL